MSSIWCRWFGIGCPPPIPTPVPPTPVPPPLADVTFHVQGPDGAAIPTVILKATSPNGDWQGITDAAGNFHAHLKQGHYDIVVSAKGYADRELPADLKDPGIITIGLDSSFPAVPTRDEMLGVKITFQGLVVDTAQFGKLPWFEACLAWLSPSDRQAAYKAKHLAGDTHCIVHIPCGPALYDEPGQPYSADRFGPLDWMNGNTKVDPKLTALIREVVSNGFKALLFLGGDSPENQPIGMKHLDLLHDNEDFRTILFKYCVVIPGWDGIFYGWTPEQIVDWGLKFRTLFPTGYAGLEYSAGHIPVGEGGADYLPRGAGQDPHSNPGRMTDFDLILGEYDDNLHQDSTWQILNRMERNYIRPADQPAGDDPARVFYMGTPNPRGRFYHLVFEFGMYEYVRGSSVEHVNANRAYLRAMGAEFVG